MLTNLDYAPLCARGMSVDLRPVRTLKQATMDRNAKIKREKAVDDSAEQFLYGRPAAGVKPQASG
jgi:hypothetical protein